MPEPMAHGYSHRTTLAGSVVTKAYRGPDPEARCARETSVLRSVAGSLPVPPVLTAGPATLQTGLMAGIHGQDLIAAGRARPVLAACGRMLRRIHQLRVPDSIPGHAAPGVILVHGDYGPNNVLLDAAAADVTAVLDWEWAHAGQPLEDLAWCEFIIRTHHPAEVPALDDFYAAYGSRPPWPEVHEVILARCQWMLELCERWEPGGDRPATWTRRLHLARQWTG
jgi:aminoglycoside phosphotransferase